MEEEQRSALLPLLLVLMVVVAVGGWVGSDFGAKRLSAKTLHWLLAVVLVIAGVRIVISI